MSRVYIGIVEKGAFDILFPKPPSPTVARLTSTGLQDQVPPENGELNLVEYERTAIAVSGYFNNGWIYSASVVDTGEPIVTALVQSLFRERS